jgi:hypothetical protein
MNHQATGNGVQLPSQHVDNKVDELQRTMNQILAAMTAMAPQAIPKVLAPQHSLLFCQIDNAVIMHTRGTLIHTQHQTIVAWLISCPLSCKLSDCGSRTSRKLTYDS